jgi:hypothetical protein
MDEDAGTDAGQVFFNVNQIGFSSIKNITEELASSRPKFFASSV